MVINVLYGYVAPDVDNPLCYCDNFFTKTLIQQWCDVKTEATILILVLKAKVGDGKDDVITGGHGFGERNGSGEKLFERVKAAYMIVNV